MAIWTEVVMFDKDGEKVVMKLDQQTRVELLDVLERVGIPARDTLALSDEVWAALHYGDDWGLPAEMRARLTLSEVRFHVDEDGSIRAYRALLKDGDEEGSGVIRTLEGEFLGGFCS